MIKQRTLHFCTICNVCTLTSNKIYQNIQNPLILLEYYQDVKNCGLNTMASSYKICYTIFKSSLETVDGFIATKSSNQRICILTWIYFTLQIE